MKHLYHTASGWVIDLSKIDNHVDDISNSAAIDYLTRKGYKVEALDDTTILINESPCSTVDSGNDIVSIEEQNEIWDMYEAI